MRGEEFKTIKHFFKNTSFPSAYTHSHTVLLRHTKNLLLIQIICNDEMSWCYGATQYAWLYLYVSYVAPLLEKHSSMSLSVIEELEAIDGTRSYPPARVTLLLWIVASRTIVTAHYGQEMEPFVVNCAGLITFPVCNGLYFMALEIQISYLLVKHYSYGRQYPSWNELSHHLMLISADNIELR